MKTILALLREHLKTLNNRPLMVAFFILTVALLAFNYTLDFEDSYIDTEPNRYLRWFWMFLFQGLPYLLVCGFMYIFGVARDWLRNPKFWLLFIAGFSLLALDRTWSLWPYVQGMWDEKEIRFYYQIINKGKGIIPIIIPLFLLSLVTDRQRPRNFYGLAIRKFDARPYFMILAIALIFISIGGLFGDIQKFYPKYSRSFGDIYAAYNNIPEWVAVLMYEIPYGFDFISTEYFFRGFLVIGMYRVLGPHAILPMVLTYCVLHFGKPLTESISSIFGGYILGVIAMTHRNIWGGVIIHVGVAWMMEFVGFMWR